MKHRQKVKKGILRLTFAMLLVASLSYGIGVGEVRADGPTLVSTWVDLANAISSGGEIRLDADVTAESDNYGISVNKDVLLDLNGHIINRNLTQETSSGYVFYIGSSATLTIRDNSEGQTGKITGAWNSIDNGGCIYVSSGSTLNLESGSIEGNKCTGFGQRGGAVYNAGTFHMTGGKITGNTAGYAAGVLVMEHAIFTMTGGEISGNTCNGESADLGAGVYAYNGSSITLGGEARITGNTKSTGAASNLYISKYGSASSYIINLSSTALTGSAQIGVSTEATDTVAITTAGKETASFFTADDSTNFEIGTTSSDNCIYLAQRGSSTTGGSSGEGSSGSTEPSGGGSTGTEPSGGGSTGTEPSGGGSTGTEPSGSSSTGTNTPGNSAVSYQITEGAGGSWTAGSSEEYVIRGTGEFSQFTGVKMDGNLVDAKNYTVREGSTIITFRDDYLRTLSAGVHTAEIVWTDGSAATTFTVSADTSTAKKDAVPKTGEDYPAAWLLLLAGLSGMGLLFTKKGEKRNEKIV